jgi:hypothetical protein
MTIEQMFLMQTQAVQAIGQTLATIQQQQQPPPQPQMPQMPRDKCAEFMRGHPPMIAHSSDPMGTEDWLHTVERELHTAQCNDRKKVLYGPRLLREEAQSWWESYLATHANPNAITWEEFRDSFRQYHVPTGLMTVKKEAFLALKQGSMSINEYRDKFLQLSRYAPEDVNTDAERQYRFLRGLVDPLQYHLMNHTFPTFQHLIDREEAQRDGGSQAQDWWTLAWKQQSPSFLRQPTSTVQAEPAPTSAAAVSKAVSSASAAESPEQSVRRRSVPRAESAGTSSSRPSNQPEQ